MRRRRPAAQGRTVVLVPLGLLVAAFLCARVGGAVAASPSAAVAPRASDASYSNSVKFTDSSGEDSLAPDVTEVVISNDNAGVIKFQITISNRPALTSDMAIFIDLDTDANPLTGDPASVGANYYIVVGRRESGSTFAFLYRWNGSRWDSNTPQSSLSFTYLAGPTIKVNSSEVGKPKKLNFRVSAYSGIAFDANGNLIPNNLHSDFAPNSGTWGFQVVRGPRLKIAGFGYNSSSPEAGSVLVVRLQVVDTVTGKRSSYDTIVCRGRIGGQPVQAFDYVRRGAAVCEFHLPESAGGRTLYGSIGVRSGGEAVTRPFQVPVAQLKILVEIGKFTAVPHEPQAGKEFYLALGVFVTRGSHGQPERMTTGSVACRATIGGQSVHVFEHAVLRALGVRCGWDVPYARGGVLVCTVRVTVEKTTVARTYRFTIR